MVLYSLLIKLIYKKNKISFVKKNNNKKKLLKFLWF